MPVAANKRLRLWLLAASLLILAFGAIEDRFGNTDDGDVFGSDAVQYLDIARALQRHDFHSALNPLWSQGYPALLAAARPLFPTGPTGDYTTTRVVNFTIFTANYLAFLYLLITLRKLRPSINNDNRDDLFFWTTGLTLFLATQICLGQVSRVNPDELVTTCFFLATALVVRLVSRPTLQRAILLGALLGIAFLVKAVFLALGSGILIVLAITLRRWREPLAAAAVFAAIVLPYGAALSHATGHRTLGEAGSLNYAWHVNRLQKWVHWEGGTLPANEAWPSAKLARLAQWNTHPPNFGTPTHPSVIAQESPRVYTFKAPFQATYTPYFNPPFFYEGYRHLLNPRYQLIALAKSLTDLLKALATQPIFYTVLVAIGFLAFVSRRHPKQLRHPERSAAQSKDPETLYAPQPPTLFQSQPQKHSLLLTPYSLLTALPLLGIAIYLPVHLEGRYLAGFLCTLALAFLLRAATNATPRAKTLATAILLLGLVGDLAIYQRPVWRNALHHKSPQQTPDWQIADAIQSQHLPPGTPIGVIAWTANLHADWAFLAHLQIIAETASGPDFNLFWHSSLADQQATLETFRRAGATAVFVNGKPGTASSPHWQQLPQTPMWIYRFDMAPQ